MTNRFTFGSWIQKNLWFTNVINSPRTAKCIWMTIYVIDFSFLYHRFHHIPQVIALMMNCSNCHIVILVQWRISVTHNIQLLEAVEISMNCPLFAVAPKRRKIYFLQLLGCVNYGVVWTKMSLLHYLSFLPYILLN